MPTVTVRSGDSMSLIAARHGLSLQAVIRANPQVRNPNLIFPGQRLNLPGSADTFTPAPTRPAARRYTVRPGDWMSTIAQRHGVSLQALVAANPQVRNPNLMQVGQVLNIPGGASVAPAPAPSGIPGAEQALRYAFNPPRNPMSANGSWHYWCLGLVSRAYQSAGRRLPLLAHPRAINAYQAYKNAGKVHTSGNPPRGALVFYAWQDYGHIGISLGNGTYVGTRTSGAQTGVSPIHSGAYLGWAHP